ncbi:MAG: ABC transporter ATP-binding protein [Elusimicrobiota bacterium]
MFSKKQESHAAALSLRMVSKYYRSPSLFGAKMLRGVENINLEITPGETFGLLGLNGSGKTTTFKLILGLLKPTQGTVSIFSRKPEIPEVRARIGYLPELPYFPSSSTPERRLRFYGRLSGIPDRILNEKIKECLTDSGLVKARRIHELSKGMLQRLAMAQAIIHDPDLLVLDEPASGLDPLALKDMRDMLDSLREKGKTILISSHGISEVEKLCDRVGIMKDGRLVRLLRHEDWKNSPGGLETLFVETVKA